MAHLLPFTLGRTTPGVGVGHGETCVPELSICEHNTRKEDERTLQLFGVSSRCESGLWPHLGSAHLLYPSARSLQVPASNILSCVSLIWFSLTKAPIKQTETFTDQDLYRKSRKGCAVSIVRDIKHFDSEGSLMELSVWQLGLGCNLEDMW